MCQPTDLACQIGNAISNAIFFPFFELAGYLTGQLSSAIVYTPDLNNHVVWQTWFIAYTAFLAALALAIVGVGLLYIISPLVEKRFQYKQILYKLGAALVLGSFSMVIGNFAIELANALSKAFLSGVDLSTANWNAFGNTAGPIWVGVVLVVLFLLIVNAVRIIAIFFLAALLPWAFLLWSFPTTSKLGKKMVTMFFEWTFVGVFMAVVLRIGLAFASANGTTGNGLLDSFIVLGAFTLAAVMPAFMGFGGGLAVSIASGMIASQITDTVSAAASGAAGGVKAGMAANKAGKGAAGGGGASAGGFGGAGAPGGFGSLGGSGRTSNPMGHSTGAMAHGWGHAVGRAAHAGGSKVASRVANWQESRGFGKWLNSSESGGSKNFEAHLNEGTLPSSPGTNDQGMAPMASVPAGEYEQFEAGYRAHRHHGPARPLRLPPLQLPRFRPEGVVP